MVYLIYALCNLYIIVSFIIFVVKYVVYFRGGVNEPSVLSGCLLLIYLFRAFYIIFTVTLHVCLNGLWFGCSGLFPFPPFVVYVLYIHVCLLNACGLSAFFLASGCRVGTF